MAQSFTPMEISSNEKDWSMALGMMDFDSTSIVFTKRTLLEFLKYTGTTVDTNFASIQKLPRYAKFGKLAEGGTSQSPAVTAATGASSGVGSATFPASTDSDFKPTRRVREPPGGTRNIIFGQDDVQDALSMAPPREALDVPTPTSTAEAPAAESESQGTADTGIKPSRRVREAPGGNSSLNSFWGSDEQEEFKPTRRVRQAPGGGTSGIF